MEISIGINVGLNGASVPDFIVSLDDKFNVGDNPSFASAEVQKAIQIVGNKIVDQIISLTGHGPTGKRVVLMYEETEIRKPKLHSPNVVHSAPVPEGSGPWAEAAATAIEQMAGIQNRNEELQAQVEELLKEKRREADAAYVEGWVDGESGEPSKVDIPMPEFPQIRGDDEHGHWTSKHDNGYRAPEVLMQMESGNPTQRWERKYSSPDGNDLIPNPWTIPPIEPKTTLSRENDDLLPDDDDVPTE